MMTQNLQHKAQEEADWYRGLKLFKQNEQCSTRSCCCTTEQKRWPQS